MKEPHPFFLTHTSVQKMEARKETLRVQKEAKDAKVTEVSDCNVPNPATSVTNTILSKEKEEMKLRLEAARRKQQEEQIAKREKQLILQRKAQEVSTHNLCYLPCDSSVRQFLVKIRKEEGS